MARQSGSSCGTVDDAETVETSFKSFIEKHQRRYTFGTEEYRMRLELFQRAHAKVTQHNCRSGNSWTAGLTPFSDRTDGELASYRGLNKRVSSRVKPTRMESLTELRAESHLMNLPAEVSWKHLQAMNYIQDQGTCGSCWAVASGTVLRAHAELWSEPKNFSIQQLVSCTRNDRKCGGSGGCDGATGELAMAYALEFGLTTEEEFPYEAEDVPCPASMLQQAGGGVNNGGALFGMTGFLQLETNKARPLMVKLVELGPIASSVAADESWFWYTRGIMNTCDTSRPIVNHLVVLVGYGVQGNDKFYELQNSWGQHWGDSGFIKLKRTDADDELCGMDDKPQDGIACEGENDPVRVCGMFGVLFDSVVPVFAGSVASVRRAPSSGDS
jgi:cathepsin L